MPFDSDGWLDWSIHAPGIPDKIYTQKNSVEWVTLHSMVGYTEGAISRFMSTDRDANGRYTPYAAASVHFLLDQDGTLIQMYSIYDSCWASGTRDANTRSVAIELEGGYRDVRQPMTDMQVTTALALIHELAQLRGWEEVRRGSYLREHNEFQQTACPSGRWARLYSALEDEMTPDERKMLQEVYRRTGGDSDVANNADLLAYANNLNAALWEVKRAIEAGVVDGDRDAVADALRKAAAQLEAA